MSKFFVPLGGIVTLKAKPSDLALGNATSVDFSLFRLTDSGIKKLEKLSRPCVEGTATCRWTAMGTTATEMSCLVRYNVAAGSKKAHSDDEIVVYRDTLEVVAKDAAGHVCIGAKCTLTATVDGEYAIPDESPFSAVKTASEVTDDLGVATFHQLPPGTYKVAWERPFVLVNWKTETGPRREAVLRKCKVKVVYPAETPHKQWVNLNTDEAREGKKERGRTLTVEVEMPDGNEGEEVYLRVKAGKSNAAPSQALVPDGGEYETHKPIAANKKTTFALDLGVAGGDTFDIEVGSNPRVDDQKISVVTWRKIFFEPVFPNNFPNRGTVVSGAMKAAIKKRMDPVFVEFEYIADLLVEPTGDMLLCSQEVATKLNWGSPRILFIDSAEKDPHMQLPQWGGPADTRPTIHCLFLQGIYKRSTSDLFAFTGEKALTSKESAKQVAVSGGYFPIDPDGSPITEPSVAQVAGVKKKAKGRFLFGLPDNHAAYVAGLRNGDRLKSLNGSTTYDTMKGVLDGSKEAMGALEVVALRGNEEVRATTTLWSADESGAKTMVLRSLDYDLEAWDTRPRPPVGASWQAKSGESGAITDAFIKIPDDFSEFQIKLTGESADLVKKSNPVTVSLRIKTFSSRSGCSKRNWISLVAGANAAHAICHEVGHSIGQADAGAPQAYNTGSGPHCKIGLENKQYGEGDEHSKFRSSFGRKVLAMQDATCLMFGLVGPKTDYDKIEQLCPDCRMRWKRLDLSVIGQRP